MSKYKIYQNIYQSLEIDDILQHKTQSSTVFMQLVMSIVNSVTAAANTRLHIQLYAAQAALQLTKSTRSQHIIY